ncbi:YheC/D like ATP-grasp [Marininema mesophilum]|uniref:YheC/D like ATP-grasp n=1 Tax=Marininema mesophilum TaxID=1048340 RepID=A0A1H2XYB1_9BACL|nr:YheC/YheD family protein [Marininema mesophilum]SDW97725.1 YheC/D like ATP-grasp [Marininema mesophilum]
MSSILCQIHSVSFSTPSQAIIVSRNLLREWRCRKKSIKISVGNKSLTVRTIEGKYEEPTILLPRLICRKLCIPRFGEVRASYTNRELRLGPVLAILTTGATNSPFSPFSDRTSLFRQFLTAGHENKPFFYVFTPNMVNWRQGTVQGWFYQQDEMGNYRWSRHLAPLPDVIYERVPNRTAEALPHVEECRERLRNLTHCKMFNQGFFNKWSVHEKLFTHELVSENIPETIHYLDEVSIRDMIDRHKMVYLKPTGGSLGMGILRITRDPQNGYYCRFRNGERNVLQHYQSLDNLLYNHFGTELTSLRRYLVQQGIRLVKYNGRPVDFRVHLHKDKTGQWKVIGIGAKVAGAGCVTTHGRTGGSIIAVSELLTMSFPGRETEIEEKISETSIRIANAMESTTPGPLGELGLDIGVDHHQKVWLFEVNSKPGRHIFNHPTLHHAGHVSARCITEYGLNLAQFV